MSAVKASVTNNLQQAQSFFSVFIREIEGYLNEEIGVNKKHNIQEACHSVLLLAPVFKIIREHVFLKRCVEYNMIQGKQLEGKLISTLAKVFISFDKHISCFLTDTLLN